MPGPVWTVEALQVLGLMRNGRRWHGYAIEAETQIKAFTVYKMLYRFHKRGLVSREIERVDRTITTRVPRIFYRITPLGLEEVKRIRRLLSVRA